MLNSLQTVIIENAPIFNSYQNLINKNEHNNSLREIADKLLGMASHHRVKRSTQVRRKRCPRDGEMGRPDRYWTWWKRASGTSKVPMRALL